MAVGGDAGGSIRIPASRCGIVGLKPTFGLVPFTGTMSAEATLEHLGPMAKTVADCALLLEVLAGFDDWRDFRQHPGVKTENYTDKVLIRCDWRDFRQHPGVKAENYTDKD